MSSTYSKGRNLEYAVRRKLRSRGYVVFRCAGSRPVDLIAIKDGKILLVECKAGLNPYLSQKQMNHILIMSKKAGAIPVLAVRKRYRGTRWYRIKENSLKEIQLKQAISITHVLG